MIEVRTEKKTNPYIVLKFGTFKSWDFKDNKEAADLFEKEDDLDMGTPEKKDWACRVIDLFKGDIIRSWTMEPMSKEEAKDYIQDYDKGIY